MIHFVSELQINAFRLLHGKIAGSLLAFFQKLRIETQFPEAVSYSLPPSEHRCILSSCCKDLGCTESMGYNQCGPGRKYCLLWPPACGPVVGLLLAKQRLREEGRNSFVTYNAHMSAESQDNLILNFFILVHSPGPDVQVLL